jgi:hypothetical protein
VIPDAPHIFYELAVGPLFCGIRGKQGTVEELRPNRADFRRTRVSPRPSIVGAQENRGGLAAAFLAARSQGLSVYYVPQQKRIRRIGLLSNSIGAFKLSTVPSMQRPRHRQCMKNWVVCNCDTTVEVHIRWTTPPAVACPTLASVALVSYCVHGESETLALFCCWPAGRTSRDNNACAARGWRE